MGKIKIRWTPEVDKILKDNYQTKSNEEMFELIDGLTLSSLRNRLYILGLAKDSSRQKLAAVDLDGEVWKKIPGFKNFSASTLGRLRNDKRNAIVRTWIGKEHGYEVSMLTENGIKTNVRVNRMVALAHIPNPNNLPVVNHENGIKADNYYKNLEWSTESYNQIHAHATGLQVNKKGAESPIAKADSKTVEKICELLVAGCNSTEIKKQVDLSKLSSPNALISRIRLKKAYTEISDKYFRL